MEVTEQVAESEKAQPEAEVVAQPVLVVEETPEPAAIERESCRCRKTSTPKRFRQKSGRLKRKP
ncbi:hypothetical protein ACNKHR_14715 [Shigella flexneri]